MPPQIKQDLNRSGWETTDFPSVCESCLPDNPYVQMLKEDYGEECKLCTRPFTVFRWKADRTARTKRTNICLTCARLKNCCQCCMLDLSFGLPIVVRDAALKMVAPGPQSGINREYYAQNNEKELEEGRGDLEEYEKTDEKARELLRKLANSKAYQRKPADDDNNSRPAPGPVRTQDAKQPRGGPYTRPKGKRPAPADILPPKDPNVTSLFVTGVEDDLPEHEIRKFFTPFGTLRSLVCSHRAHCAFVNFATRESAEAAAEACQGKAVIAGCPLRVRWGKPKPLDSMEQDERMMLAKEGREVAAATASAEPKAQTKSQKLLAAASDIVAAPPGKEDVQYGSLAGD